MSLLDRFLRLLYSAIIPPHKRAVGLNFEGLMLFERGRPEEALERFNDALRFAPDLAAVYINRASVWARRKNWPAALADCERALRLDPASAEAYGNRGVVRCELGDSEAALADFNEALRLNPDHPNSYKNLAWLQATCPDDRFRPGTDAVRNANRAMELDGHADLYSLSDQIAMPRRKTRQAQQDLLQAMLAARSRDYFKALDLLRRDQAMIEPSLLSYMCGQIFADAGLEE